MNVRLHKVSPDDVDVIVGMLVDMQEEVKEFQLDPTVAKKSILDALQDNVIWFLFQENGETFGTCYLQSVHNYWRAGKRFYLGGFYIKPSYRGRGLFRRVNDLLVEWASEREGVQIYCHIHQENTKSLQTFSTVEMKPTEYSLCVHHWGK